MTSREAKELSIRHATVDDLPRLLALYRQLGSDQSRLSHETLEEIFHRIQTYPNHRIYVTELDRRVVGALTLMIMDAAGHRCLPVAIVEDVVVEQTSRGQGIGALMMAFVMERAREAGCYKLMLSSNLERESAHRFYESLGFEKHGYSYLVELR